MKRSARPRPRLLFLAPGDARKARVEPISWMRTCEAFARRGFDVTLLTIRSKSHGDGVGRQDIWRHFDMEPSFNIVEFNPPSGPVASIRQFRLWGALSTTLQALALLARQWTRPTPVVVYSRAPVLSLPFIAIRWLLPRGRRPRLVAESHVLLDDSLAAIIRRADLLVVTSERLRRDAQQQLEGLQVESIPLGPFNPIEPIDRDVARRELGLPADATFVCYSGKMIHQQLEFFVDVAEGLAELDPPVRLLLVGGNPDILPVYQRRFEERGVADTVQLTGFVEPRYIPLYQSAADVLLFHMAEELLHWEYCTPAKGFEYQAARRPIVATDLPLFDEVFGDRAIRVPDRTPAGVVGAVERILREPDAAVAMTDRAATWIADRTWQWRVDSVLAVLDRPLTRGAR
jgi:glycosyltransferase involved in cell wall biosynthesis